MQGNCRDINPPINPPLTRFGVFCTVHSAWEKTMRVFHSFVRLLRDDSGATAIEYGLIAALVAVAAVGAMTTLGTGLSGIFTTVSNDL
jgi:pilus assembly protein Flp/PilA